MSSSQCFICRAFTWDVTRSHGGVELCLPCYVDVLEIRQGRGLMGPELSASLGHDGGEDRAETGQSPSPDNFDLFSRS